MTFSFADLDQIAARLRAISARLPPSFSVPSELTQPSKEPTALVRRAHDLLIERRKRDRIFEKYDLFGEPSWDILLDLFVMDEAQREVSVSSAVIASSAPSTTGLRHLAKMVELGLIERVSDPRDKRRFNVRLTSTGMDLVRRALS